MHPHTERLLTSRGLAVAGWTTTAVSPQLLRDADLVLTATREHSSFLIGALPHLRHQVIPLRRFARLAASARQAGVWSPSDDLPVLLDHMGRMGVPGADDADDVADPVDQPYRRFKACARIIDEAGKSIIGSAAVAPGSPPADG